MQESKYQVINWKRWKDTKRLLEETRDQLKDDRKQLLILKKCQEQIT